MEWKNKRFSFCLYWTQIARPREKLMKTYNLVRSVTTRAHNICSFVSWINLIMHIFKKVFFNVSNLHLIYCRTFSLVVIHFQWFLFLQIVISDVLAWTSLLSLTPCFCDLSCFVMFKSLSGNGNNESNLFMLSRWHCLFLHSTYQSNGSSSSHAPSDDDICWSKNVPVNRMNAYRICVVNAV